MPRLDEIMRERTRPLLMGIVNVTGDSFSEGGASSPATAVDRALALLDEGADLLDIGGESTRPGAAVIPADEESLRVVPVLRELRKLRPSAILSVDTRKAGVARAALDAAFFAGYGGRGRGVRCGADHRAFARNAAEYEEFRVP